MKVNVMFFFIVPVIVLLCNCIDDGVYYQKGIDIALYKKFVDMKIEANISCDSKLPDLKICQIADNKYLLDVVFLSGDSAKIFLYHWGNGKEDMQRQATIITGQLYRNIISQIEDAKLNSLVTVYDLNTFDRSEYFVVEVNLQCYNIFGFYDFRNKLKNPYFKLHSLVKELILPLFVIENDFSAGKK